MIRWAGWLVLVGLAAVGTALLGWWVVPILAALYGLAPFLGPNWWAAALAGGWAWALLLLAAAVQGPTFDLAEKVAGVFSLPGWAYVAFTLLFPAVLAGAACELAISARRFVAGRSGARAQAGAPFPSGDAPGKGSV